MSKFLCFFTLLLSSLGGFHSIAYAYETDQYETVGIELKDATEALNTLIQAEIEDVVALWQGKEYDEAGLAFDISSRFSRRQIEVWGVDSPYLDSYSNGHNSIYNNVSPFFALMQYSKGLAPTVSVDGVHIGLDKLTHFFGVGALYLHVARQSESFDIGERAAINFGKKVERTYWGTMTTGVYSNADMVANYEGFRFLSGLFTDNTVAGKPALLGWDTNGPRVQRAFDIRDYVNDYWNEVFNPNSFASTLSEQIVESLELLCGREQGSRFSTHYVSASDQQLLSRYRDKGLRSDRSKFMLPKICGDYYASSPQEREKHQQKQSGKAQNFSTLPINVLGLNTGLSKVKETITSPICRQQVQRASAEHELLLKSFERDAPAVWDKLEKRIKFNELLTEPAGGFYKVNRKIGHQESDKARHQANTAKSFEDTTVLSSQNIARLFKTGVRENHAKHQGTTHKMSAIRNANNAECYTFEVADLDKIIRKGFTLQIRLCLEKDRDGNWHKNKQYVVSFDDGVQRYLQNLDPIMLNFFDAQFTHYSSNTLDYFSWDQRVGYVYRTISPLCRWF